MKRCSFSHSAFGHFGNMTQQEKALVTGNIPVGDCIVLSWSCQPKGVELTSAIQFDLSSFIVNYGAEQNWRLN